MKLPYLLRLSGRLSASLERLDPERRQRHSAFVRAQQQPDGGFAGREGGADLYYTSFALRALAMLDGLDAADAAHCAAFLKAAANRTASIVDLVSWLSGALAIAAAGGPNLVDEANDRWADRLAAAIEEFRTRDGGYAKSRGGAFGSTYHSFLVALCYEIVDRPVPAPERLLGFVRERRRDDGGFVEIGPMKRSGTNPTAAGVALVDMFAGVDDDLRQSVQRFLAEVRTGEGGFAANTRMPIADLLSTFTALLTAQDLGIDQMVDYPAVQRFAESLELPDGGFRAALWDAVSDVEYTFYGLGVLGLAERGGQ
jgi:geranylgeranyl transferase type-2 subunit beta